MRFLSDIFYILSDLLAPSFCCVCREPVSNKERSLCPRCLSLMEEVRDACPVCSSELEAGRCPFCSGRYVYFDKHLSLLEYRGTVRDVFHAFKFRKQKRLFSHFTAIAGRRLAQTGLDFKLITYVPMTRRKRSARGFNQSELFARALARDLGIPCKSLLREKRTSNVQKELGYRGRFINALGRYSVVRNHGLKESGLLLIDDIFTTGATLNECSRVLKKAGSGRIFSLTLARAPIKRLEII